MTTQHQPAYLGQNAHLNDNTLKLEDPYSLELEQLDDSANVAEANAFNAMHSAQARIEEETEFSQFAHLSPTRQIMAIEDQAIDKIQRLREAVQNACDKCEQFNDLHHESAVNAAAVEYVSNMRHSQYKLFWLQGQAHRNQLLAAGQFPPEGFHVFKELQTHGSPMMQVYLLADGFKNPAELYASEEARKHAEATVTNRKAQAEAERKAAQRQLAAYKAKVEAALDAVPTLKKLLKNI